MSAAIALYTALGIPLIAIGVANLQRSHRVPWIATLIADLGIIAVGIFVVLARPERAVAADNFRLDQLAGIMLLVIGSVAALASATSRAYLDHQLEGDPLTEEKRRLYWNLFNLFTLTMILAVVSNNLGITWIAVEATTVSTTFLVGFKRTPKSLEAAWKYAIICSFGLSVALLGVVVLYFGATKAGIPGSQALLINVLLRHASELNPDIVRIGIGLCIIGFGAKAGLVPFHTWLPDAHSQAPAPISAMMSGVLLSVASSVVLRVVELSTTILGPSYGRLLLLTIGILTMGIAALLIIGQTELKRMLAQSSMEQMGLVAIAIAINSELAIAALLLHIVVHGIAKSSAFITAGQMEETTGKHQIADIAGMLRTHPQIARGFILAVVALVALPPFGLFWSEAGIITATVQAGYLLPAILVVLLLLIASVGLVRAGLSLTISEPRNISNHITRPVGSSIPILVATLVAAVVGLLGTPTTHIITHVASNILQRV
ncbi:proton-conducting transporter membrane subunit [Ferrimicrobium sp.]|uniref:proton-conducting transporter transmembrane domain-containing protein n=1 Tax=Ferrimicrobium sp. TaxID=2926050 RepID=UPI0026035D69|nr:proton-conducting transporter membrane subunit [Ferrimicrobium sp.]